MRFIGFVTCVSIAIAPAVAAEDAEQARQARFFAEQLKITEGYSPESAEWRHATVDKVYEGKSAKLPPATARYERSIEQQNTAY